VGDLLAYYRREGLAVPPAVKDAALKRLPTSPTSPTTRR